MRLVTYAHRGTAGTGALVGDAVVDVTRALARALAERGAARAAERAALAAPPGDLAAFLAGGDDGLEEARGAVARVMESAAAEQAALRCDGLVFGRDEVRLHAPVRRPGKLACMWVNYRAHGREVSVGTPDEQPVFFSKFPNVVIGPGDPIELPRVSRQVDYEAELAVIIGRRGKDIPEARAYEYVAGYTILNDVSARDFNLDQVVGAVAPYVIQKTFDSFAPMGPCLVTRDEIRDPNDLAIRLWLDGELLQDGHTSQMVFRIPEILSYLSRVVTLEPGDVISTGTPPGSGHWRKPPRYLRAGDTVRIEVGELGVLENPVRQGR